MDGAEVLQGQGVAARGTGTSTSAPGKGLVKEAAPLAWGSRGCGVARQTLPLSPQAQEVLPGTSGPLTSCPTDSLREGDTSRLVGWAHILFHGTTTSAQFPAPVMLLGLVWCCPTSPTVMSDGHCFPLVMAEPCVRRSWGAGEGH